MGRKAQTLSSQQAALKDTERKPTRRRKSTLQSNGLTKQEITAAVCNYMCHGYSANEITTLMKEHYGVVMNREMPYRYISHAAIQKWLRFQPPYEFELQAALKERYDFLDDVEVVHTSVVDNVAHQGAVMLTKLLKQHRRGRNAPDEVHVGLAGGHAMRKLCRSLAQLLRQPSKDLPRQIVFHAMVAGFDIEDPTTAPNSFFTYFVNDPALQVEIKFVGLHAPAMIETGQFDRLKKLRGIEESYQRAKELDIIVTSAGHFSGDGHTTLEKYMSQSDKAVRKLKQAKCVGDVLWLPLGPDGPIQDTNIRAMTLVELSDLPGFISRGKNVLLVLGPCGKCHAPKTGVLRTVLNQEQSLITHLVADSRSVRDLLLKQD